MSRPPRFEYPGAWWHVTNRGVEQRDIFCDHDDHTMFMECLASTVPDLAWRLHAYVLMNNHFHLFVETPQPTLSEGVKEIEESYARTFNRKWARVGHLFQGRFKTRLVDSERYVLNVSRYIVLNPVRAGLSRTPGEWQWSSYRATAGMTTCPSWLTTTAILDHFDPWDPVRARVEYCRFVGDPNAVDERLWDGLADRLCLGGPEFVARVNEQIERDRKPRERAIVWRDATLDQVRTIVVDTTGRDIRTHSSTTRMLFAYLARSQTRASVAEIAGALGVTLSGFGRLKRRAEQRRNTDARFAETLAAVQLTIRSSE